MYISAHSSFVCFALCKNVTYTWNPFHFLRTVLRIFRRDTNLIGLETRGTPSVPSHIVCPRCRPGACTIETTVSASNTRPKLQWLCAGPTGNTALRSLVPLHGRPSDGSCATDPNFLCAENRSPCQTADTNLSCGNSYSTTRLRRPKGMCINNRCPNSIYMYIMSSRMYKYISCRLVTLTCRFSRIIIINENYDN